MRFKDHFWEQNRTIFSCYKIANFFQTRFKLWNSVFEMLNFQNMEKVISLHIHFKVIMRPLCHSECIYSQIPHKGHIQKISISLMKNYDSSSKRANSILQNTLCTWSRLPGWLHNPLKFSSVAIVVEAKRKLWCDCKCACFVTDGSKGEMFCSRKYLYPSHWWFFKLKPPTHPEIPF